MQKYQRIILTFGVAIALSGCGPSKVQQCTQILEMLEATRSQKSLGTQTREGILQNAALSEQLATQLEAETFRNAKIQEYVGILIEGYRKEAAAGQAYAQIAKPDGTVSVRVGDTAQEQAWQNVQTQKRQAANQIGLGYSQLMSFCSI